MNWIQAGQVIGKINLASVDAGPVPVPKELPAVMRTTAESISQSLSGQYAIRLFGEERPTPVWFHEAQ